VVEVVVDCNVSGFSSSKNRERQREEVSRSQFMSVLSGGREVIKDSWNSYTNKNNNN